MFREVIMEDLKVLEEWGKFQKLYEEARNNLEKSLEESSLLVENDKLKRQRYNLYSRLYERRDIIYFGNLS